MTGWRRAAVGLLGAVLVTLPGAQAPADALDIHPPYRIATWNVALDRDGPGLLLRDIRAGEAQVAEVVRIISESAPDVLVLTVIDHDHDLVALHALRDLIGQGGPDYPHLFALPGNSGVPSGLDLDGDGRLGRWSDSLGFGRFPGARGLAVLSRLPIQGADSRSFDKLLWRDLPGASLPMRDGAPWPSAAVHDALPLAATGIWDIALSLPDGGALRLWVTYASPPLSPEAALRNADQISFWHQYLAGTPLPDDQGRLAPRADAPFVLAADLNVDPDGGDGDSQSMAALLRHPLIQDPLHGLTTASWPGIGTLRVDYVLPMAGLLVTGAGLVPPTQAAGTSHALVWVDLDPAGASR